MKKTLFISVIGLMLAGILKADPLPAPSPTPNSSFSPSPTSTPQVLTPRDLPPAIQATVQPETIKKPSPWMTLTGFGIGLPMAALGRAYGSAFQADLGSGLKVSKSFSLWLDVSLGLYGSRNNTLTGGNNYTMIEAALWARYRLLPSALSPYLFAGPGLAYNENRSNGVAQYDPYTGYGYVPINAYEVDFLAEAGLGMDYLLSDGVDLFLQGKLTYDFTSPSFASYAATDSPIVVVPLEAGLLFGI